MLKFCILCFLIIYPIASFSEESQIPTSTNLYQQFDEKITTDCPSEVFATALYKTSDMVSETDSETKIQQWIYQTFRNKNVLEKVLACPEFTTLADEETISFSPIEYTFPEGRQIIINYETQPKILKQHLTLATKRNLSDSSPNPFIGYPDDASIWTNTDPAWYSIMVVEAGSLKDFVGPNKSNTISMKYINDNIDKIYPKGAGCTSKSALASDNDIINIAMHDTVNITYDTNDYYVAGDANLQWISYLEIGLDVAITIATFGSGAVILGTTKAARASRTLKNLSATLKTLNQTDAVRDYIKLSQQYARATEELKTIDRAKDAATYARKSEEINNLSNTIKNLENTDDTIRQYKQVSDTFTTLNQYRRNLRLLRPAQRGNIIARTWRAFKSANTGGKELRSASRIAQSGTLSSRVRDWLFQSSLANIGALAKLEEGGGLLYGAIKFVGGMYDWTETSTGDFTNDIEFKPLTLLSADDLIGQENVINHGMWLMWLGNAFNAADDDAAFLQAMDFANKFHYNIEQTQENTGRNDCNVDIYVVRPVIRNPGTESAELYYLIMNDKPWTTTTE